jgi:hypothetical protein
VGAVISATLTVLLIVWIAFACDAINKTIAVIQELNKVLAAVPMLVVWTLTALPFAIGVFVLLFLGLYFFAYPFLSGDITSRWESDDGDMTAMGWLVGFHLLVCIWLWVVIVNTKLVIMAHTVAYWFYEIASPRAEDRGSSDAKGCACGRTCCGCKTLLHSTRVTLVSHMGSIIFASAITAVARLISVMLRSLQAYSERDSRFGKLAKFMIKCLACCWDCCRKTIEQINAFALIYVATEGVDFCSGAKLTFQLLFTDKYSKAVWLMLMIKHALTLAMKWSIIVFCTCVCYWYLDDQPWFTREHNALYPSIAVLLVSYFISSAVSDLYVAMMDTILMLCIKDIKHGGQNIPPGGLRSAFNVKTNDQVDQEKAARKKGATSGTDYTEVKEMKPGATTV